MYSTMLALFFYFKRTFTNLLGFLIEGKSSGIVS